MRRRVFELDESYELYTLLYCHGGDGDRNRKCSLILIASSFLEKDIENLLDSDEEDETNGLELSADENDCEKVVETECCNGIHEIVKAFNQKVFHVWRAPER